MIATTIEQSKHLLELGLDPTTADLMWVGTNWGDSYLVGLTDDAPPMMEDDIPSWSLSALLEVMPKYITDNGVEYKIEIWTDGLAAPKWVIGYSGKSYSGHHLIQQIITIIHRTIGDDLLTAAYEMVVWLIENGYIKKGGDDA